MKKTTIIEIKKLIDYTHEAKTSNTKSQRTEQVYRYLMNVHEEVKKDPVFYRAVNKKAAIMYCSPKYTPRLKSVLKDWIDNYSH